MSDVRIITPRDTKDNGTDDRRYIRESRAGCLPEGYEPLCSKHYLAMVDEIWGFGRPNPIGDGRKS